jgi:DNA-3-methyladenine glycosylase I
MMKKRCEWAKNEPNLTYHDNEWGVPEHNDQKLFEFLILEGAQAGLSWTTILNRRNGYRDAFSNFDVLVISKYTKNHIEKLVQNKEIIRNKLKINAAIHNASVIMKIKQEMGSFQLWLDHHHPKTKDQWVKLFKKTFKFTGGEITGEFLMSTGYLEGAHHKNCPIFSKVLKNNPTWYSN